jgi:hypothetical protein
MAGTFLDHLEDLVLQTSGISERVNELIEVLEHQTPLIWGSSNEFGNSEISTDSPDFITAVEQVISNLLETSRRFVVVGQFLKRFLFSPTVEPTVLSTLRSTIHSKSLSDGSRQRNSEKRTPVSSSGVLPHQFHRNGLRSI